MHQHKTIKFDMKGERTPTLYILKYIKNAEQAEKSKKMHCLKSQSIFSEAFKMKWSEPFDFPTILEFLDGRYLDPQMVGTLISQNFYIYMLTWTPEKWLAPDLTQVDYIISKFQIGCHKYLYTANSLLHYCCKTKFHDSRVSCNVSSSSVLWDINNTKLLSS